MWEQLPSHLRTALAVALLLVIGVAVASFTLSFIALREVASNPLFGWGRNAWIFPACVDAALVASEVTYIAVSMIKGINRALPFSLIVLFGAVTVWFNTERVPAEWRMVTAIPPLAGLFMTLLIAFMLKVFARITGKAMYFDAPPSEHHMITGSGGPLRGAIYRPDYQAFPTNHDIGPNGHNGHELLGDGASKASLVRAYLDTVEPGDLRRLTAREIQKDLERDGHHMTVATISPVLTTYRKRRQLRRR